MDGVTKVQTTTDSTVAIMGAMGFTACFVSLCIVISIGIVVASVQRTIRRSQQLSHQEKMETQRLAQTKEITVSRRTEEDH